MPKIEDLVGDIYNLLDEDSHHEPSEENLNWIANAVKETLRERLSSRERKEGTLRFSSLGRPDRQQWYAKNCPEKAERMEPATYMKFLYGALTEIFLLFLIKEAGHEVTHEQSEVEVEGVKGHTDCIVDGVTVDIKTASPYGYGKFVSGTFVQNDPFGYIAQISGYRSALGTDRAGFLVANKVSGQLHFAEVSPEVLAQNEPRPRIEHLRNVLSSPTEPERCYPDKPEGVSGNRILDVGCSYCPYKFHCWRDSNGDKGLQVYAYSNGPKFLTKVVKEPKVAKENW